MPRSSGSPALVLGLLVLGSTALAGCGSNEPTGQADPTPVPQPPTEWPFASGTLDGRRASTDAAIVAASLPLAVAWNHTTAGAVTGTPTVADGRVFAVTWKGHAMALDARTGAPVWEIEVGAKLTGSVTVANGTAYFGDDLARLHAVDAATGQRLWNVTLDGSLHAHLYATPLVLPAAGTRGALIVQAVGSDQESSTLHGDNPVDFRGSVAALDPATGAERWRTPLMEGEGTGAPVWGTPVWDAATDTVVFGTGNAYSGPAGTLTDAIIGLNASDGTIRWSYQATANDIFTHANPVSPDDDFGSTPSLVAVGNRTLAVLGQKSSVVWAIDVATGTLAWKSGTADRGEGVIGDTAAADGRVFVPYVTQKRFAALDAATGQQLWSRELAGLGFPDPVAVPGAVITADTSGQVLALDAATGDVLWNTTLDGGVYGGLSVAGGRLYVPIVATGFLGEGGAVVALSPGAQSGTGATAGGGGDDGAVLMQGFEFVPSTLRVPPGQAVTWRNVDPAFHTVTFVVGGAELVADPGETVTWTFTEPGTYEYYCRPHASQSSDGAWIGMTGRIVVE